MFAQFRKFRMFGLDDNSLLTPEDLLRQSRSAAFVRNYHSKEDGLGAIVSKVEQLIPPVLKNSIKRKWIDSPFSLVRGFTAVEIQRTLRAGQMLELRPFLTELSRPLHPWLRSFADSMPINDEFETVGFELKGWSRSFGAPVLIRFGRKDFQHKIMDVKPNAFISGVQVAKIINSESTLHFVGATYLISNLSFNGNFESPVLKRSSHARFLTH
jgi:hypothetical protein